MEQCYTPIVIDPVKGTAVCYSIGSGNLKLMEHSSFGSPAIRGISALLETPKMLFWMGDCANSEEWIGESKFRNSRKVFLQYYQLTKRDGSRPVPLPSGAEPRRYLINHVRERYIDLEEYRRRSQRAYIHPLSLLTACGNGEGEGDYRGSDMRKVGLWAGDLLEVSDTSPSQYIPMDALFLEDPR